MDGMAFEVNLGAVQSYGGKFSFSIAVDEKGMGQVRIFASDPSDLRKSGVLMILNEERLNQLDDLLEKVHSVALKMRTEGRMKELL